MRANQQAKAKRILFRLNSELAYELDLRAKKAGTTKSKLIRSWLAKPINISPHSLSRTGKDVSFEFIADAATVQLIDNKSAELGIARSLLLRMIIRSNMQTLINVNSQPESSTPDTLGALWRLGKVKDITNLLGNDLDKLNQKQLLDLAIAQIIIGEFSQAETILTQVNLRSDNLNTPYSKALINSLQAYLLIHRDKHNLSTGLNLLHEAMTIAKTLRNRELLGYVCFFFANAAYYQNNVDQAVEYYELALDYLDIIKYPNIYATICIELSWLWGGKDDWANSQRYLDKANLILHETNNAYGLSAYYRQKAVVNLNTKGRVGTEEYLLQSVHYLKHSGSVSEFVFTYEELCKMYLYNGDYSTASRFLHAAAGVENTAQSHISLQRVQLYQTFIESKNNYQQAAAKLTHLQNVNHSGIESNLWNYVHSSMQYIHGDNPQEKIVGEYNLKKLAGEAPYKLLRQATLHTLQQKRLYPSSNV